MLSIVETHAFRDDSDAAAALGHVQAGQAAAARRMATPWWFHPLAGLAGAVMVSGYSLPLPVSSAVSGSGLVAFLLLAWLQPRLTGVRHNWAKIPSMRLPMLVGCTVAAALFAAGALLELRQGVNGGFALAGVAGGVWYVAYWRWIERQLARECLEVR